MPNHTDDRPILPRSAAVALFCWLALTAQGSTAEPDEASLRAAGIRRVASKHLTLYTDLPAAAAVDELPRAFDLAVPQWASYLGVERAKADRWKATACVMKDRNLFRAKGLLPGNVPQFKNGYALGNKIWVLEQPSEYYRRHLLLHEGTHAFMFATLENCGPPWFMEGTAELIGTHRFEAGKLTLRYFPSRKEEVPKWGRIRLVKDDVQARRRLRLPQILAFDNRARRRNETYGWVWAACAFLDGHPRYQKRFRAMLADVGADDFNDRFRKAFSADWRELNEEWLLFLDDLQHGYDLERTAIDFRPGDPLPAAGKVAEISAAAGWQSSRVRLEAGKTYQIEAAGRFRVARKDKPWLAEPGGITIRYYKGRPLGILLGAIRSGAEGEKKTSQLYRPREIGLRATWTPKISGTLYLRINDSAAELSDNDGQLSVRIRLRKNPRD